MHKPLKEAWGAGEPYDRYVGVTLLFRVKRTLRV